MDISKKTEGDTTTIALVGRLDTVTSAELSNELEAVFASGAVNLVFDFSSVDYVSSAGLRVMLIAQKKVNTIGTKMEITGMKDAVREIFDITGFSSLLKII